MLKIVKKVEVESTESGVQFVSEKSIEERVRGVYDSARESVLYELADIYRGSSSINAESLAKIMKHIIAKISEENCEEYLNCLLQFYQMAHDENEFRFHIKNTHKFDPVLALLVLLERKEHPQVLQLASTIIDAFTLNLMLNGRQVIVLWKKHIKDVRIELYNLAEIKEMLKKREEAQRMQGKKEEVVEGFRRISIPL